MTIKKKKIWVRGDLVRVKKGKCKGLTFTVTGSTEHKAWGNYYGRIVSVAQENLSRRRKR